MECTDIVSELRSSDSRSCTKRIDIRLATTTHVRREIGISVVPMTVYELPHRLPIPTASPTLWRRSRAGWLQHSAAYRRNRTYCARSTKTHKLVEWEIRTVRFPVPTWIQVQHNHRRLPNGVESKMVRSTDCSTQVMLLTWNTEKFSQLLHRIVIERTTEAFRSFAHVEQFIAWIFLVEPGTRVQHLAARLHQFAQQFLRCVAHLFQNLEYGEQCLVGQGKRSHQTRQSGEKEFDLRRIHAVGQSVLTKRKIVSMKLCFNRQTDGRCDTISVRYSSSPVDTLCWNCKWWRREIVRSKSDSSTFRRSWLLASFGSVDKPNWSWWVRRTRQLRTHHPTLPYSVQQQQLVV